MRAKPNPTTTGANPQRVRAEQERRRTGGRRRYLARRQPARCNANRTAIRESY